jgi:hypothetical protein
MQLHFARSGRFVERCSNERHPAARHYSIRYAPYHYSYWPSRNGVNGLRRAEIHSWRHFNTIRIVHFIVCLQWHTKRKNDVGRRRLADDLVLREDRLRHGAASSRPRDQRIDHHSSKWVCSQSRASRSPVWRWLKRCSIQNSRAMRLCSVNGQRAKPDHRLRPDPKGVCA